MPDTEVHSIGRVCTACGTAYDLNAKYCGVDGAALRKVNELGLSTQNVPVQDQGKLCPTCNKVYPSYCQFCPTDAAKLTIPGAAPAPQANKGTNADRAIHPIQQEEDEESIGHTFAGKYKVDRLLGEGGMAKVYLATHVEIEKTVVIKVMRNQISAKEKDTSLKRFLQEIKVTAKLNHPNLVSVFDGGDVDGRPYLVMEYIEGNSLRAFISEQPQVAFTDAITLVSQMCAGLQEAHLEGIVHRDLKPENIMLRENRDRPDWVKVVDFGISHLKQGGSKLTATGIAIGTVDYMSPEYLSDRPIDHRADIYALGVILYELLTGQCPFESECTEAILAKHLWTTPTPPSQLRKDMTPGCRLDTIVERALEKDPSDRFQSAADMGKALQQALSNPAGPV